MYFIDLFAGCGGLSLGLKKAGWQGLFAIEKTPDAFETLRHNLIYKDVVKPFQWPDWLPCEPMTTSILIEKYAEQLSNLKGKVDLIAGGPPCQGFSFAGRRNPDDPRNKLTEEYIQIVEFIRPKFLLFENVKGFKAPFKEKQKKGEKVYADVVKESLENLGYHVFQKVWQASDFGVPQPRARFIMIAVRCDQQLSALPFHMLRDYLPEYKQRKGLKADKVTTLKEAISDLEISRTELIESIDDKKFKQIRYKPRRLSAYQKMLREGCDKNHEPNSLRLARHKEETLLRFEKILREFPKGKSLTKEQLEALGTKKQSFTPLHPDKLACTITTLPDDTLHYSEPRILTVREHARIQSFPDWFDFMGKYTTGGARRREECPRYTQVGNAVPPLMAEALGEVIRSIASA